MFQSVVVRNKLINGCCLTNITQQSAALFNRKNYTLLNNNIHLNLCEGNKNLLNCYSINKCHINYSNDILLKRYISDSNQIENNKPFDDINKKEQQSDLDKKINKPQKTKKKEKGKKNNKKSKSDFSKILISLIGGIGIGYGINYYINNKDKDNIINTFNNNLLPDKNNSISEPTKFEINNDNVNKDLKNDVTVDIRIKEKTPDDKISVTKINYDSKKDPNNFTTSTTETKASIEVKQPEPIGQNDPNPIMKNINDTFNYISSLFGFGNKEEESMSEFDKEIEEAYTEIINNINKAPSEIKINNLRNNESININADSINNEKSIKEIEEKLKSWGTENSNQKSEKKTEEISSVDNNNMDSKEDENKIADFVNDIVKITDDTKANKKIIKVSAKPIAKAFHEASKLSNSLEKNKDNLPEFLADCIKETTDVIMKLSNDNVDIQNTFLDTVKIFSDSMNVISDYLDQLEIEIKTELNDDKENNNVNSGTKF